MGPPLEKDIQTAEAFKILTLKPSWNDLTIDEHQLRLKYPLSDLERPLTVNQRLFFGLDELASKFRALPLEVTQIILNYMDLTTLTFFERLGDKSKALVDSVVSFGALRRHAPEMVQAMLTTGAGSQFTVSQIIDTLQTQDCRLCGSFGGFIYLIKCVRCCFKCATKDRRAFSIPEHQALSELRLDDASVKQLPGIETQGRQSFWSSSEPYPSMRIVDFNAAVEASTVVRGAVTANAPISALNYSLFESRGTVSWLPEAQRDWSIVLANRALALKASRRRLEAKHPCMALPEILHKRLSNPEKYVKTFYPSLSKLPMAVIRPAIPNPLRFLSFIRAPVLYRPREGSHPLAYTSDSGTHCCACRKYWNFLPNLTHHSELPMYSSSQITEHLLTCPHTRYYHWRLWQCETPRLLKRLELSSRECIPRPWSGKTTNDDVYAPLRIDVEDRYKKERDDDPCLDTYYRESQADWVLGGDGVLLKAHCRRWKVRMEREKKKIKEGESVIPWACRLGIQAV